MRGLGGRVGRGDCCMATGFVFDGVKIRRRDAEEEVIEGSEDC